MAPGTRMIAMDCGAVGQYGARWLYAQVTSASVGVRCPEARLREWELLEDDDR